MIATFDEVIYVDWNSPGIPLIEEIANRLIHAGRLRYIVVTPKVASELTCDEPEAQKCCEVLGRNIGLRRASGEWIVSTNIDVIAPRRELLGGWSLDAGVFYVFGRRDMFLRSVDWIDSKRDIETLQEYCSVSFACLPPSEPWKRDPWSLIAACGDFQLAHRILWDGVKGFEESLIYRACADVNVQKKAALAGFGLHQELDLPVIHIRHDGQGRGSQDKYNDYKMSVQDFEKTANSDGWGFPERVFPGGVI